MNGAITIRARSLLAGHFLSRWFNDSVKRTGERPASRDGEGCRTGEDACAGWSGSHMHTVPPEDLRLVRMKNGRFDLSAYYPGSLPTPPFDCISKILYVW